MNEKSETDLVSASFLCIERSDYEDKVEIFAGYDIETVVNKEKNLLELIW